MVLSLSPAIKHAVLWEHGRAPPVTARKSLLLSLKNVYETLAISAPTVVDAVRGRLDRQVCDARLASWAEHVMANAEVKVTVAGRENADRAKTYLIMSNHQSHYDVAVIYYVLGSHTRMVAKRELFRLPVFGQALRIAGFVSVDRGNRRSAIASLEEAKSQLKAGTPMWIAPEGTRSTTGELLPFKKGGFVLALATGAPILPVTIRGTRNILPAHGARSTAGVEVTVTIHPEVDPGAFAALEPKVARDRLMGAVRGSIERGLA
jgi:1-acyl-sn-glycerol-3-phosphate acyltransferase